MDDDRRECIRLEGEREVKRLVDRAGDLRSGFWVWIVAAALAALGKDMAAVYAFIGFAIASRGISALFEIAAAIRSKT